MFTIILVPVVTTNQSCLQDFDGIKKSLQLPETSEIWRKDWDISQKTFPSNGLFFLEKEYVRKSCEQLRMKPEVVRAFLNTLPMFDGNNGLKNLAWHCQQMFLSISDDRLDEIKDWPQLPSIHGEMSGMFYPVVLLGCLSHVNEIYHKRGMDSEIMVDTLQDMELWICGHQKKYGIWGFREMRWLALHFTGRIYRLGRLQFELTKFPVDFHGYYSEAKDQLLLLAGDQMTFRADGQLDGTNGIFDSKKWISRFEETSNQISGHPISPVLGKALNETIHLQPSEWEKVLQKGDSVLNLHIPAIGPMDHVLCGESIRQAKHFFKTHFPDFVYRVFACNSWLLDSQLEACLPPTSNICRFLREFYLFPWHDEQDDQIWYRVFKKKITDLNLAPQETSLQRAVIDHVRKGGQWRKGGGIILATKHNWGSSSYRKQGK